MEKSSDWMNVSSGVPQGSVLGPILFIIYINDMPDMLRKYCKMLADDAKLYSAIETTDDKRYFKMNYLIPVIGVKTGYWSIIYINVNAFNMEMSNMSTIIK